jgi:hypothetical protein
MEDQSGAPSESVVTAPFSELISAWLDEGDRLDEKALATAAATPPPVETRVGRLFTRLRPALERHRVFVLAGAGLIPFALFALTHRSVAAPAPIVAAATVARVATPSAPALAWPEQAQSAATAPSPASAPPSPESAGMCERTEVAPAVLDVRPPEARPAPRPQHHHHHHAAKQPAACVGRGPCALARPVSPGAHAAPAAPPRHTPAPTRTQLRR